MVKKSGKKKIERRSSSPAPVGDAILILLKSMGGSRERSKFSGLWEDWDSAVGEELASVARPAGHRGRALLLGAEDAMAMQEIQARSEEILERVNAYLGEDYFLKVKAGLAAPERGDS